MQYDNALAAIKAATIRAPAVVGYKTGGWVVYEATEGAPQGVEPELFCPALGTLPMPLTAIGAEVLASALCASKVLT